MDHATIRESLWCFQALLREYREVMIVAKGIRQGVRLIRQGRELARLDRLQHLELMPQIFHLLAPFMQMLLRRLRLGHRKCLTAIPVDALQPGPKYRPAPPPKGPAFRSRPCCL